MSNDDTAKISFFTLFSASLLVAGNVLGVGILAVPIKLGISGYIPTVVDILFICALMLVSAYVIAARLPTMKKNFDIPSFFQQELGLAGRWIAIVCNLILLYGVIVAYFSGISVMIHALIPVEISQTVITLIYFLIVTSLIMFGRNVLARGNTILLFAIWISFIMLAFSGTAEFNLRLLAYTNWKFIPIGLPVAVSAFHFHNIIPTVSKYVKNNLRSLYVAITLGVGIGLVMNLVWITIVLGSLPESGAGADTILSSFAHGVPATVPMTHILHSKLFATSGLVFAILAVTASCVANGTGLFGFIRDLTFTYLKVDHVLVVGALSFLPPLIVALVYPQIFLSALDIVGGVGETMLFAILPGIILVKMAYNKSRTLIAVGAVMTVAGSFIFLFILAQKFGITHLSPLNG